jgi:hypothetical protein
LLSLEVLTLIAGRTRISGGMLRDCSAITWLIECLMMNVEESWDENVMVVDAAVSSRRDAQYTDEIPVATDHDWSMF